MSTLDCIYIYIYNIPPSSPHWMDVLTQKHGLQADGTTVLSIFSSYLDSDRVDAGENFCATNNTDPTCR